LPRVLAAVRYRQSWRGVVLHPVGVLVLMAIQWRALLGGDVGWKGRTRSPSAAPAKPALDVLHPVQ